VPIGGAWIFFVCDFEFCGDFKIQIDKSLIVNLIAFYECAILGKSRQLCYPGIFPTNCPF
jgi:hypothetical protein